MVKNCPHCHKETEQKIKVFHPEKVNSSFANQCTECGGINTITHRCECGKTFFCKYSDSELCYDCRKEKGVQPMETDKLRYKTKIDYNKYIKR